MNKGFVMLSRKFFSNKIWEAARTFSECEAWLFLIQAARFEATDKTERIGDREITYGRGQYPASIRFLAKKWRWSERAVRTFLAKLVKERMITTDNSQGMNVITLCKYDEYNGGTANDTTTDTDNAKEIKELKEMVTQLMTQMVTQGRHTGDTNSNKGNKGEENKNNNFPLSPDGDIPPGEAPTAVEEKIESRQSPPALPPEKEKSSAKKEKELAARVVAYYHERCPSLPRVKTMTPGRVASVMARIREHGKEAVAEMIAHAGMSSFLAGDNDRGWTADFDWIFKPKNFVKVYEGKFDNKLPVSGPPSQGGRPVAPFRADTDHKRAERDSLNKMALAILHDTAAQDNT